MRFSRFSLKALMYLKVHHHTYIITQMYTVNTQQDRQQTPKPLSEVQHIIHIQQTFPRVFKKPFENSNKTL